MRVLLNGLVTVGAKTGIGHYASQLIRCLREQAPDEVIDCFPGGVLRQAQAAWLRVRPWVMRGNTQAREEAGAEGNGRPGWRAWLVDQLRRYGRAVVQGAFARQCRRGGYTLYHEPNFVPFAVDVPTVATIHDLSVLLHPQWHPADRVAHFERRFHEGLARCRHFFAISEFARREIIAALGLRPDQVTRTYMGIRPGLGRQPAGEVQATLARLGLPPRYLLYLGTIEPRKNVLTLLKAYCALPPAVRERHPLLLVGGWGWNAAPVADYLAREGRHRGVRHVGYVPDESVPALYSGARALAFPSFYEGFGLPPLEMMACGGAVLASTAGALVETVGCRAHLLDPRDEDGWRAALLRVATDDDWWRELRRGAEAVARPFTWDRCAADTLAVYRALSGARRVAA
jgi:alpha-1,3-rhamnosyl/mannosyltransferase